MKEFISLIINTLGEMENSDSIQISKISESEYSFSGIGTDLNQTKYKYMISAKYSSYEEPEGQAENQALQELKEKLALLEIKVNESSDTTTSGPSEDSDKKEGQ